jgi:hypothetical protein
MSSSQLALACCQWKNANRSSHNLRLSLFGIYDEFYTLANNSLFFRITFVYVCMTTSVTMCVCVPAIAQTDLNIYLPPPLLGLSTAVSSLPG